VCAEAGEPTQRSNRVISRPYLCFAACCQIVLQEIAGLDVDQIEMANRLGIVLPTDRDCSDLTEAGVTNIRFDADPALWGIAPAPADVSAALRRGSEFLECRFEDISQFQDWELGERLSMLTEAGQFPIVGFDYSALFGGEGQPITGHCVVVYDRYELNGRLSFRIYDPGPKEAGFRVVDSESLYFTCRKKHGGIWLNPARLSVGGSLPTDEPESSPQPATLARCAYIEDSHSGSYGLSQIV
jgi:hypothetical protein